MYSTRRFPDGLRVLVVNYNSAWLNDTEATLRRCNYKGTIFRGSCKEALDLLKEKKHDVVLCGLNNLNNGAEELEFLQEVAGELELPVTCAISNEEDVEAMVKKYARHTVNFVVGPATEKDLMTIWQHTYRKMLSRKASAANNKDDDDDDLGNNNKNNTALAIVVEESNEPIITATTATCNRQEKQKLIWTEELHGELVGAVERTGVPLDKVTPKQILREMNIPGITRDQVSSHLQKYRKRVKDEAARKNLQQSVATAAAFTSSAPPRTHRECDAPVNQDCAQQMMNQYDPQVNQESAPLLHCAPPSLHLPDQVISQESALHLDCSQQIMDQYDPQVNQEGARLLDCAPPSLRLPDQVVNQESALHLDCAQQIMYRHPQAANQESAHRSDCAPQMMELPQLIDQGSTSLWCVDQLLEHLPDLDDEEIARCCFDYDQLMMELPQLIDQQESIGSLCCAQEIMHLSDLVDQESAPCFDYNAQQMRDLSQLIDQGSSMRCLGCSQQITHFPYLVDQDSLRCFSCTQQIMRCPPQEVNQESENHRDGSQRYPPREVNQESANRLACDRHMTMHASSSSSRFYATCS